MHQNLWLHYAASRDGDRAAGIWPRFRNAKTHSYEVHNDWIQLLEEYGVVGFVLFLVAAFALMTLLLRDYAAQARARRRADWSDGGGEDFCILLASLLIVVAIGFHSLGDFNLQIPGTNWMFAGILSIGSGLVIRRK
jgi:O-antigen ligase